MLRPAQVAARLSVSPRHVRRLMRSGALRPTFRISHRVVLIPESALSRILIRS